MAASFSTAVYVESPPAVVFEALTNLDAAGQWMPNVVRIEKLTAGPIGPGAEFRETRKMFGKESTEQFRVTRFDRPSRIDLFIDGSKGTSGRGEYAFVYELLPERTGTNVELTGDIRMPGIWGLLGRFMIGGFKKACHKDLEALKAHLESAWPANPRP
jgi:uncharacterized protein YndB with AHSA1/START domain